MTGDHEPIAIGDEVRMRDGRTVEVKSFDRATGLYAVTGHPVLILLYRHQFTPLKWENDVIGVTGIGVCAAGGAGQ
ncbi:hypothetical protein SJ05684_c10450 [Sinorhizobium sojae CCBAU 05684]|uniref:Uncharacterized protein n=1 Tax=Sinorhizobium sojae CCBAU 05684 TaxID=716928 RepID=A0A249P992_9HYPH|nr:hypothetical protein [Sinorhizobium sojae]ASY62503.1 hypothetical protein SJ05684_c10450 [Sinorhizobium sojae CCBAU 05684]